MKLFTLVLISVFATCGVSAQKFSINLFAGTSNYQGDLQDKRFTFNQAHFAGGIGVSYDLNEHFTIRSGITFAKISGDDAEGRNSIRNLNFSSGLTEGHLGLQYYITPLGSRSLTPYVFAGLAVYHFNPYTYDTAGAKFFLPPLSTEGQGFIDGVDNYNLTQIAIPFGAGVKLSLSENINVGIEFGIRKTFTDYLDDLSTDYVDETLLIANRGAKAAELAFRGDELKNGSTYPAGGSVRGGAGNKDWYYFTGLTLSFRLGNGSRHTQYGCPVNVY